MSSQLPPSLGSDDSALPPRIGGGGSALPQRIGGLDAPSFPSHNLTRMPQVDPNQITSTTLEQQAMGRATMILDQVRNRKMSWQDAETILKPLSDQDKQTIAKFRGNMNEDERRALGMSKGGGGLLHSITHTMAQGLYKCFILGPELIGAAIGGNNPVSRISGNFTNDVGTTVRATPAGIAKVATAAGEDIVSNPIHPSHHLRDAVIKPMLSQYGHTYGPMFHGNFGLTAGRLAEHPLQPITDALAVASMGVGTAARVGAVSDALAATKVTRAADGTLRMGTDVPQVTKAYEPLGYSMRHYVKPTPEQMANEPYMNHFSVLIDTKTGDSLFSPVGGSHDEIYDPMFDNRGTATKDRWDNPAKHPGVIQATGVFDPETGKVASININPEDMSMAAGTNVPKLISKVKAEADKTYVSAEDLKRTTKTNEAGSMIIAPGKPRPGEPQLWYIRKPNGQRVASNFPSEDAAVAHAQSLVTGGIGAPALEKSWLDWTEPDTGAARQMKVQGADLTPRSQMQIARQAYFQRSRGSLIDAYERARGISHTGEIESILNDVVNNVLDNPDLQLGRRGVGETVTDSLRQVAEDISTTWAKDVGDFKTAAGDEQAFPKLNVAMKGAAVTLREISDMVRASAVFLRPAYIPNNWAGNGFLNAISQGVFAPLNMAKAFYLDKHIGTRYTRAIDQAMGFNAAQIAGGGRGAGYVSSAVDPVAHFMGRVGDQPFRRSEWIHQARRLGYGKMSQIQQLWDQAMKEVETFQNRPIGKALEDGSWDPASTPALHEIGKISRAAQEEIIKFGKYNDIESGVLRNLIFVYSWMRGAGRYFGRFPFQHPIQAAVSTSVAAVGQNWLNQSMGGVPSFLIGAIPVGKDKDGNTILINPFTVNPLGTGAQLLGTATSIKKIIDDPKSFNKYVDQDPAQLLNPLVASAVEAYGGGRPIQDSLKKSLAWYRLYDNLQHPGRGQIYPTSRMEAIGQYTAGSMYPRKTSQQGITRSLERERKDQPAMRIDDELKLMQDKLHFQPPQFVIDHYRQDLQNIAQEKDFQHHYASSHGSQGFTNMPPANRAEAAIDYLSHYHLVSPAQLENMTNEMGRATTDQMMNQLANSFWNMTGSGHVKRMWDNMVRMARQRELTTKRP